MSGRFSPTIHTIEQYIGQVLTDTKLTVEARQAMVHAAREIRDRIQGWSPSTTMVYEEDVQKFREDLVDALGMQSTREPTIDFGRRKTTMTDEKIVDAVRKAAKVQSAFDTLRLAFQGVT